MRSRLLRGALPMKTYFFHLRDGEDIILDPDGIMLPNLPAVVARALVEARAIIGADAVSGTIKLDQRIDVENRVGVVVHTLAFDDAILIVGAR
jgi:hypothetical protein